MRSAKGTTVFSGMNDASDVTLATRLRTNDESALTEIWKRFGPLVRSRLRGHFQHQLNEDDLDDVISGALFRLWQHRFHYATEKGTLLGWFYVIARSATVDFLRRPSLKTLAFSVDDASPMESAEPGESDAESNERFRRLWDALKQISKTDEQILLAFANSHGQGNWARQLENELQMPASTIRSRKHRAIIRLRAILDPTASRLSTRKIMATQDFELTKTAISTQRTDFAQRHSTKVEDISRELQKYYHLRLSPEHSTGLSQLKTEWNAEIKAGSLDQERKGSLAATYQWLHSLASFRQGYRDQIAKFLAHCETMPQWNQTRLSSEARESAVDLIERALSAMGTAIESEMPDSVCSRGEGMVLLHWSDNDANIRWDEESPPISLRKTALSALRKSANLGANDALFLADQLVSEIRKEHDLKDLSLPNFDYANVCASPKALQWRRYEVTTSDDLPPWLNAGDLAPIEEILEIETQLERDNPELATLLDDLICAAAREDHEQRHEPRREVATDDENDAQRIRAVESLMQAVAGQTGRPADEIAALFAPRLAARQSRVGSPDECAANSDALAFLQAQLIEP